MKYSAGILLFCLLAAIGALGASKVSSGFAHVIYTFPVPDSENAPGTRIHLAFDRPIDPATMAFDVWVDAVDGSKAYVAGSVEVSESRTAALFRSYRPLPAGDINVRSVVDRNVPHEWTFVVKDDVPLHLGRGGPILLLTGEGAPFGSYLTEILRAEGFTNFRSVGIAEFSMSVVEDHGLIITAGTVPGAVAAGLGDWVSRGGHLIAIRPSAELAELAGLRSEGVFSVGGNLAIDTDQAPGQGLVSHQIQFHGSAERYLVGADTRTLATLSSDADEVMVPGLTVRAVGDKGGEVAAFAFDLAQSVILTRQGNPQWAGQDRDGLAPIRPNDLFFGMAQGDPQPDFLDVSRAWIPQADEKLRLLTNLIHYLQRDAAPIPRFWYFPNRKKAVLIMAADDHGTRNGTRDSFNRMLAADQGCDVLKWECERATSWLYPSSGLSARAAKDFVTAGFDVGSHVTTFCKNWSAASLDRAFAADFVTFGAAYPDLPAQRGSRLHCIVWSDYTSQAEVGRHWGVRFDMNYYLWPKSWLEGRAGFLTGSGLPMRFSSADGELIDVYQQETHLVDEVFFGRADVVERLIQRALGPEQFFGAFGTHYDFHNSFDETLIGLARKYDVPMVSARQMMDWQDGRSQTDILYQRWDGESLQFTIAADERTSDMLTTMLPTSLENAYLVSLTRDDVPVPFDTEIVKGVSYALFPGLDGEYRATYGTEISALSEN